VLKVPLSTNKPTLYIFGVSADTLACGKPAGLAAGLTRH